MLYAVDVDAADLARFRAWYDHEHLPERVRVPGFLRGRRYAKVSGPACEHLTLYDAVDTGVFSSPDYLARLDSPTALTRSVVATFRRPHRAVLSVSFSVGAATGSQLSVVHLPAADPARLRRWVEDELAPEMLTDPDACGLHLGEVDVAATAAKLRTAEGRDAAENVDASTVLLFDGTQAMGPMCARLVERCRAAGFADDATEPSVYEHVISLLASPARR